MEKYSKLSSDTKVSPDKYSVAEEFIIGIIEVLTLDEVLLLVLDEMLLLALDEMLLLVLDEALLLELAPEYGNKV